MKKKRIKQVSGLRLNEKASERVSGYADLTGKSNAWIVSWMVERFDEVITLDVAKQRVKIELEAMVELQSNRKKAAQQQRAIQQELAVARKR